MHFLKPLTCLFNTHLLHIANSRRRFKCAMRMFHDRAAVQQIEPQLPPSLDIVLNNRKYTDSIEGYSLPANTNINSAAVLALEFGRQMQIAQRQPNKLNKSLGKPVKNCNWFRFSARPLLAICNKSVKIETESAERERDWQILNMAVGYKLRRPECPTGFTWLPALAGHNLCPD